MIGVHAFIGIVLVRISFISFAYPSTVLSALTVGGHQSYPPRLLPDVVPVTQCNIGSALVQQLTVHGGCAGCCACYFLGTGLVRLSLVLLFCALLLVMGHGRSLLIPIATLCFHYAISTRHSMYPVLSSCNLGTDGVVVWSTQEGPVRKVVYRSLYDR